jgi:hypothetical protein
MFMLFCDCGPVSGVGYVLKMRGLSELWAGMKEILSVWFTVFRLYTYLTTCKTKQRGLHFILTLL